MSSFKITDKYIAFVNAMVSGMTARDAYIQNVAVNESVTLKSASATASRLLARPEMKQLLERTRLAHEEAITGQLSRQVAKEFQTTLLTTEELDNFHSAIVQGLIEVEEVVPVYRTVEKLDQDGNVIGRAKEANFVRVKRPPNVKEKQASADALYKRRGSYVRMLGNKGTGNDDEPGEGEDVQRVLILSNGDKINIA